MQAKVTFRMANRNEYTFTVEGSTQTDFYDVAKRLLDDKLVFLADTMPSGVPPSEFFEIESWHTTLEEKGMPGKDKADGIATRSPLQKLRFDLIPVAPLTEVAKVFTFGAYLYGDRNWEEGFSWSRCIGSIWRHFTKWLLGEDLDDESKLHHLAHVIANCLFLLQYTFTGKGIDDRQKASAEFVIQRFQPIDVTIPEEKGN